MSFDLILPVCLKIIDGKTVDQTSLSDTMQIIIGNPYGLVAVMMLIVFNILAPCVFFLCFFLFLYPCQRFSTASTYREMQSMPSWKPSKAVIGIAILGIYYLVPVGILVL